MQNNAKIGIIGGDMRQVSLASHLSELGYEIATWGIKDCSGEAVKCADWKSAIKKSSAVILPLPTFVNGRYVIDSHNSSDCVSLSQILSEMDKTAILLGGKVDDVVKRAAAHHKITVCDCFEDEMLQIRNAVPTAEAAVEIALSELPITLYGAKAVICGYGRIGKILSRLLKNFGTKVYVAARKDEDLAYIETDGNIAVSYGDGFLQAIEEADVLFNTVPSKILNVDSIEKMAKCRLIIDLASKDGGVDFNAAAQKGIKSIHATALPGKTAPLSAGKILAQSISNILTKQGVIPT